jgi:hypothetical protein
MQAGHIEVSVHAALTSLASDWRFAVVITLGTRLPLEKIQPPRAKVNDK